MTARNAAAHALVGFCVVLLVVAVVVPAMGVGPGTAGAPAANGTDTTDATNATNATGADDWPQYRAGPGHAGSTDDAGPAGPYAETRWVRRGGEANAPPVVADGTVFTGYATNTEYTDYSGVVRATNLTTGETAWRREDVGAVRWPMAVADGLVFVPTVNTVATDMGYLDEYRLLALDAGTGETVWRRNLTSHPFDPLVVANGTVYQDDAAFDAATGDVRWEDADVSVAAVRNGTLYGTYDANESIYNYTPGLVAWDADDHAVEWRWAPGGTGVAAFAVANGSVYATVGSDGTVALAASDGSVRWRRTVDASSENGTVDWLSAPAVSDGTVYVATNDARGGTVHALDATDGTTAWQFRPDATFAGAPVVADDTVYVGGHRDGMVGYGLNASTGEERWHHVQWFDDGYLYVDTVAADGLVLFTYGNALSVPRDDDLDFVTAVESSETPSDETPVRDIFVCPCGGPPNVTVETEPPNATGTDLDAGTNVTLTANVSDPDGDVTAIEWDVDGDGDFDRSGESVTVSTDFCGELVVTVRVTDESGWTATESVTLSTV